MEGEPRGSTQFSRELVDAVLRTAPGFILAVEPDGTILFVNRVLRELQPVQVVGKKLFDFVEPGWRAPFHHAIEKVLATDQPMSFETQGPGPGGQPTTYLIQLGPVRRDGRIVALTLFATDVGEAKLNEQALRDSEEKLRLAVEATGMGVWSWDARSDVVVWDDVMCRHFRVSPADAPTTYAGYRELIYPADRDLVVASVGRAVETGAYEDIEHRIELPDGEIRWLLIKGHVERDERGEVQRLTGGVFDITERRRLDEKLRHAQKLEAVGQLAAGVAHNFNNTLTSVLSSLQLIARRAPADLQGDIADAIESARGAAGIVGQLVNLAGHSDVEERRAVAVDEVVERVARMCRRTFDRRIAIEVTPSPEGITAVVNPSQLEQALLNLCINARDAVTAADLERPLIQIAVDSEDVQAADVLAIGQRPAGRYARIQVTDNGTGIDAASRERIFEPFFTTKAVGGSGLGLATANATIVEHDGWMDCDSTPTKGTVFTMHLPACDIVADAEDNDREREMTVEGSGTVLLVDDESLVRSAIARLLEDGGFTVVQAANGTQAIELFESERDRIDVVLLDHSMPGLSGRDVLERMLAIDADARVVMFTGYAPGGAQYPGAAGVLTKPADENVLFSTLREAAKRLGE